MIDDDIDDVGLFKEALKRVAPSSVSFQYYNEGNEALVNLLDPAKPLPDIVFLDINMPKINGWQCLSRMRQEQRLKRLPVIIYSTSSEPREIKKAKELDASGFLTKPNDFDQLKKILASILASPPGQLADTLQKIKSGG